MMDLKKAIELVDGYVSKMGIGVTADTHELRTAIDICMAEDRMRITKPVVTDFREGAEARSAIYRCPSCGRGLYVEYATDLAAEYTIKGMKGRYCHRCGQGLDWSETGLKK